MKDKIREHVLEAVRVQCSAVIPADLVRDVKAYELEPVAGETAEGLLVSLEAWIYGERRSHTLCLTVPSSWWQHFKQDCFPGWAKKYFPVRYRQLRQTVHAARLFPQFVPPKVGEPVARIMEFNVREWSYA